MSSGAQPIASHAVAHPGAAPAQPASAPKELLGSNPVNAIPGVQAAQAAVSGVGSLVAWIGTPHNVVRVLYVVGGIAAMLIGIRMLADTGGPVGAAAGAVKSGTDHVARAGKSAATATVAALA